MRNIHFVREPGFTYDLFFYFVLYFNKEYCMTNSINYNKSEEDVAYLNHILAQVNDIPDELHLFFLLPEDGLSLLTRVCFDPYEYAFITSYGLSLVQEVLKDYQHVAAMALDFYFPGKRDLQETPPTTSQISLWIRESSYDASLKSSLYAFFFEPEAVTGLLSRELSAKAALLSQQYEENAALFAERERQFDLDALTIRLRKYCNDQHHFNYPEVFVSFNLLEKNRIYAAFDENQMVLILGLDYADMVDYVCSRRELPELHVLFNVLAEKNRVKILDFLIRKGEVAIQDIERELALTGTNAYYHLNLMIKANIIRARSVGRTVFYSPNRSCFHTMGKLWERYEGVKE